MTFVIEKYDSADKTILILQETKSWDGLAINIDYDDVDRDKVDKAVVKMVAILNKHWND